MINIYAAIPSLDCMTSSSAPTRFDELVDEDYHYLDEVPRKKEGEDTGDEE